MTEKHPIRFEFECIDLPQVVAPAHADLRLGIQEKQDVKDDVPHTTKLVRFTFVVQARLHPETNRVTFSGAYVQGPRDSQFVYLCWGQRINGDWQTVRRAKVPLKAVTPAMVEEAISGNQSIRARIRMTDAKGQPLAASVKADQLAWIKEQG